jgi:hypothetical protein
MNASYLAFVIENLAGTWSGIMANHALPNADNTSNEAVVTGLIAQRPGFLFPDHDLFEDVQSSSADGNSNAQHDPAFCMPHICYDTSVCHEPRQCHQPGRLRCHVAARSLQANVP